MNTIFLEKYCCRFSFSISRTHPDIDIENVVAEASYPFLRRVSDDNIIDADISDELLHFFSVKGIQLAIPENTMAVNQTMFKKFLTCAAKLHTISSHMLLKIFDIVF